MRIRVAVTPSPPRSAGQRIAAFVAALFCASTGVFALGIALLGPRISGGIPLLPDAVNQIVGRIVFAGCSVLLFGLTLLAIRDVRTTPEQQPNTDRHE